MAYLDLLVDDERKQTKSKKTDKQERREKRMSEDDKQKKSFWDRFSSNKKQTQPTKETKAKTNLNEKESTQRTTSK